MTFTLIIEKITAVFTFLSVIAPVALTIGTYIYRTEVIEALADFMQPAITASLRDEVKPAIKEVLMDDTFVTTLDSNQMAEIQTWIRESNEQTVKALPVLIRRAAKTEVTQWLTHTYKVYNGNTGAYIREETGVLTDTGWIIIENYNP